MRGKIGKVHLKYTYKVQGKAAKTVINTYKVKDKAGKAAGL